MIPQSKQDPDDARDIKAADEVAAGADEMLRAGEEELLRRISGGDIALFERMAKAFLESSRLTTAHAQFASNIHLRLEIQQLKDDLGKARKRLAQLESE